jgi:hypothetical protein
LDDSRMKSASEVCMCRDDTRLRAGSKTRRYYVDV